MSLANLLIPVKKFTTKPGSFRWPAKAILQSPRAADLPPLRQLACDLAGAGAKTVVTQGAVGDASLVIRRDARLGSETYKMTICPAGIEIQAGDDAAAYYAIATLRDLLAGGQGSVPCGVIDDRPDFARRGVYLDCSRGKVPTVESVKQLIELLAGWKINELQLYIENVFTFAKHPQIGKGYSPFTVADILEMQEHCKAHHVKFVGSLASFGHMEKILQLPQYAPLGEMPGFRDMPGGTTLCPGDGRSIRLLEDLYSEFVPLLEADNFNICGDEPWELGKGRSKKLADRIGVGRVYLDFLKKIHRLCQKHGKRMNAWADIVLAHSDLLGEFPKDIVMLNWDYSPHGKRIARTKEITDSGFATVVCPGTNTWNSHGCRLQMGVENIADFAAEGIKRKAEGLLNTDWGDGGHRNMLAISLHNYAWGAGHSWNHRAMSQKGFTENFCRHVFGMDQGLAGSIRTLGSAYEALGLPYANGSYMYRVPVLPLSEINDTSIARNKLMHDTKNSDLLAHHAALAAIKWPLPRQAKDGFAADSLAEFELATRQDMLACSRSVWANQIHQGQTPPAAQCKALARETIDVAALLEKVWMIRNRPSRLATEIKRMLANVREYAR